MNSAPANGSFASVKRKTLEDQRQALLEEYQAANAQLTRVLSDVERVRLERQLRDLEQKIAKVEEELAALDHTSVVAGESGSSTPAPGHMDASPVDGSEASPGDIANAPPPPPSAAPVPMQDNPQKPPRKAPIWIWYFVVVLLGFVLGVVTDLADLFGLSRCTALWLATASALISGVGILGFSWLPDQRSLHMKKDRAILGGLTLLVTVALAAFTLISCRSDNHNSCPTVDLVASPEQTCPGQGVKLAANAKDPEGDALTYTWKSSERGLVNEGEIVAVAHNEFVADPSSAGKMVRIEVAVDDKHCGKIITDNVAVSVTQCDIPPTDTPTPTPSRSPTITPTPTATATATPSSPTILNLRDGDLAPYATSLLGEYPTGMDEIIRVFVVPPAQPDSAPSNYYPQSYNHCQGNDGAKMQGGRWEQHIQVGLPIEQDVGQPFEIVVTTATAEGNAAVVAEIQRWCDDPEKKWPGFAELPAGVDEVERITVIRSDELLRAPDLSGAQLPGALRITSPRDGQTVTDSQTISGIYSNVPPDHAIWVLVYTIWGKWLPQSSNACAGEHTIMENGQWRVAGSFQTNTSGEPFDVVVVVADPEAGDLFDQKQRELCAQATATPNFRWLGLLTIELPSGIAEKDRIQVVHESPPPIPTPTPTPTFVVFYEWPGDRGWECWNVRTDLTGSPYGVSFNKESRPAEFVVDFSSAAENKGMIMYNGDVYRSNGERCGDLVIPESASIEADVRVLDTGANVQAELFMQTTDFADWFAGRPTVDIADGSWRTLRPNSWVTGLPPVPISRQDKEQFVTLGIELNVDGAWPAGPVRVAVSRVRVIQR